MDVLEQATAGGVELGIGERIKNAREAAGLTQHELAEKIGVKTRQIQYYEADESNPYRKLSKIADATGKSIEWLREEEMPLARDEEVVLGAVRELHQELRLLRKQTNERLDRLEARLPQRKSQRG